MGKPNPQKSGTGGDLHAAARSGDLIAVQSILISNPLAVNSRDKHSRTPYPQLSTQPYLFFVSSFIQYISLALMSLQLICSL